MQSPNRHGGGRARRQSMSRIPARLNILMGIVVLMLGILGWRLGTLQITDSAQYKQAVKSADTSIEKANVQRGVIYDSSGKALVSNQGEQAITYTKPRNVTEQELYTVANEVGKYVTIKTDRLSDHNYANYYVLNKRHAKRVAKLSQTEAAPGTDDYAADLTNYVERHQAKFPLSASERNQAMLFQKMVNAYALSTIYLKEEDVSQEEIASIGERQAKMPGVRVGLYYKRESPSDTDAMASIIGSVSTSTAGLPENSVHQLLTKGYSRDDSVGTTFLEAQYQDALKGTKKEIEVKSNAQGESTEKTLYPGQPGSDLHLTINAKFQADVQDILKKNIPGGHTQGAYAVVLNPNTGGVYAMGGVNRLASGKLQDDAMATINRAEVVGSVVKPAMITNAMLNGTISPSNSVLTDQPIQVAGTAPKSSWFNRNGEQSIPLIASDALMVSSNSYVMQLMLKMAGKPYSKDMSLANLGSGIFQTMREGFNRFGLGVDTGIDLPGEVTGIRGSTSPDHYGNALDESFGQYDTYTTMQLAQYVATIANGGYRVRPHVVQSIKQHAKDNDDTTPLETTVNTQVLGTVGWTPAERNVIWEGMRKVVHGKSPFVTGSMLKGVKPAVYAKTGTAETTTDQASTLTYSLVSFVPDADVAMAIVVPGVSETTSTVNQTIAQQIYEAYWKDVESKSNVKDN